VVSRPHVTSPFIAADLAVRGASLQDQGQLRRDRGMGRAIPSVRTD
jgi:hypothetical protein